MYVESDPHGASQSRVSGCEGEREGLNLLYQIGGAAWLMLGYSCPSLSFRSSMKLIREGLCRYEELLETGLETPGCLNYTSLIEGGYLKKKHWVYACYMATLSSLPLLHKVCSKPVMLEPIVGKTSIGASTKLLDNLNDSVQTVEEALDSLSEYEKAMVDPWYNIKSPKSSSKLPLTVNSSYIIGNWTPKVLARCNAPIMYSCYVKDVKKLIEGQVDSILHKSRDGSGRARTIAEYLTSIAEKSIGDVWLDVDLCFLEEGLAGLDSEACRATELLKAGYSWIFKSSLIYDDAQDLRLDLEEGAINSVMLLGMNSGVITFEDIGHLGPLRTVELLEKKNVVYDTIRLADMLFLKGVDCIQAASAYLPDIIDWKALMLSFRFIRLFNLRKRLMKKKDWKTLNLALSSIRDFRTIESDIPDHILTLGKYL